MEMDPLQHEEANIEPRFFEYFSFSLFSLRTRICYNFSSSKFSTLVLGGIRPLDGLNPPPMDPLFPFLVPPFMKKKIHFYPFDMQLLYVI